MWNVSRRVMIRAPSTTRAFGVKRSSWNGTSTMETLYRAFMKRNMTYVTTIVIATIAAEAVYGTATDSFWETMNRGVRI